MGHPHHDGAAALERRAMQAYRIACHADVACAKPGNVRVGGPAHGMTARDFLRSARVSAAPLACLGLGIGERVLATRVFPGSAALAPQGGLLRAAPAV